MVRNLSEKRRPTIGLILNDVLGTYQSVLWSGVTNAAAKLDVDLICFLGGSLGPVPDSEYVYQQNTLYDLVNDANVDGLIISTTLGSFIEQEEFEAFCKSYQPLPIVTAGFAFEGLPAVMVENKEGLHELVEHLIEKHGYRRIAFIQGPRGSEEADLRYEAYAEALKEHGLAIDPDLIAPGDYLPATGREAVALFVDQRGLEPGVDFEAVVAANDSMALAALEELQDRGVRVPEDVAVVGFDDDVEARSAVPALTTVRQPIQEIGAGAVEFLLSLIEGDEVPEQVVYPTQTVIRQSCGCFNPTVIEAGYRSEPMEGMTLEAALNACREETLDEIADTLSQGNVERMDALDWARALLEAFVSDLTNRRSGAGNAFLVTMNDVVHIALAEGGDLSVWQGALSVLRRHVFRCLTDAELRSVASDLLQQGRVLLAEVDRQALMGRVQEVSQASRRLNQVSQTLATTFNFDELTSLLAEQLPQLGVPGGVLAFYEDPDSFSREKERSAVKTILAFDGDGRLIDLENERYPAEQLFPRGGSWSDRRCSWVMYSLYFQDDLLGYALFEIGTKDSELYSTLETQINGALKSSLLVEQVEHRALQLQTAAEVSRAASSILDLDELIDQVVELARDRFDLYYAGLFLVDEAGEWAVLQAGTGEAGERMLAEEHKLEVGSESMIGWSIANKEARIAFDVGEEAVRFDNPHLPETRSELALPLIGRGEVVGALTVQSTEEAAFSDEDIAVLKTMADQLANAIVNARFFEQAQEELNERRRMEDRLAQERDLLRLLMDSSPDYIFFKDRESRFIRTNEAHAHDLLGIDDPQEAVGKTDFDFFPQNEAERFYEEEQHIMGNREPVIAREWEVTGVEESKWTSEHKLPWIEDGEVIGLLGISRDVTARKRAERALERRALQLQTTAEISQAASSILEPEKLVEEAVQLIQDRLDLYYAGLFLVDETGDRTGEPGRWAVLRAGTGEAGEEMLAQGHRLEVGGESMIGRAIESQEARIALDVGDEAVRFENPHLPETRSELALPLISRGEAIGALTIQSTEEEAFSEEDIAVLQTMADQVANAIQNARLYDQAQEALEEMRAVQRRYVEQAWSDYAQVMGTAHYESVGPGAREIGEDVMPEIEETERKRSTSVIRQGDGRSKLVTPIVFRDAFIGALGIHDDGDRQWTDEEIALVEAVADRVALAAENLRLLDQTQRRAQSERLVRQVMSRVRERLEVEDVLQTAVQEMFEAMEMDEVVVQLLPDSDSDSGATS